MVADIEHGLDGYRQGCRCTVCRAANTAYMRSYRAQRRGLEGPPPQPDSADASVTVLPAPVVVEDAAPGAIEQAVLDETATLSGAARRPTSVRLALALARDLDDRRLATSHASQARQLEAVMASLRDASTRRQGRLASVATLAQRGPATGVG
jgi:hypothetical protein